MKARASDPELFEASYAEWVEMAEGSLKLIQSPVARVRKVSVDADELSAWCLAHGKKIDASARAAFASYKLSRSGHDCA